MKSNNQAPQGWLPFLRAVAGDAKIKFVIGNNVAPATNGETVWLPELPAELTKDDLILFKGNSIHEIGHIKKSNIKFFQAFSKKHGPFAQFLLNALDDVFMEGGMANWKAMAARYLRETSMVLVKRKQFRDGSKDLSEAVGCFALVYLTSKQWPEFSPVVSQVRFNLERHLGEHADELVPKYQALLDSRFGAVRSTEDAGELALTIIELFKQSAEGCDDDDDESGDPSQEGKTGDESGDPSDEGESGNESGDAGKGDKSGDGSGDAGEGGESGNKTGDPSEGGTSGDKGDSSESGAGSKEGDNPSEGQSGSDGKPDAPSGGKGGQNESTQKPQKGNGSGREDNAEKGSEGADAAAGAAGSKGTDLKSLVEEMLKSSPGDAEIFDKSKAIAEIAKQVKAGSHPDYSGAVIVNDLVIEAPNDSETPDFVEGMPVVERDAEMAKAIQAVTGRKAMVTANRLRALLANRDDSDYEAGISGQLCDQNLYRFGLGDSRIFERQSDTISDTAAVSITADLSGSTLRVVDGTSIAHEICVALSLLEKVFHEIGSPLEIMGFGLKTGELNCVVRTFQDNHRVALERIGGLHKLTGGWATPTGEAVMRSGTRLMCHEANRKLLMVLTDGVPSSVQKALDMTNYVSSAGVEVIYLVIGSKEQCTWLEENNIKYVHAPKAELLLPAMTSKVSEFMR